MQNFENLGVLFLFYIEEAIALAVLGPTLFGIRPGAKDVAIMGVLQGVLIYLVRNIFRTFNISPFVHTFVLLLTLIIIIRLITGASWGIASASSIVGFIVLIIGEMFVVPFLWPYLNLTFEKLATSTWLHILSGYLADSLLFILAIIVGLTKFSLIKSK